MISKPTLDTKTTGGVNGQPQYAGETTIISTKSADMSGGDSSMSGASTENLSAKFKNPNVKQDIPEKARNQYE